VLYESRASRSYGGVLLVGDTLNVKNAGINLLVAQAAAEADKLGFGVQSAQPSSSDCANSQFHSSSTAPSLRGHGRGLFLYDGREEHSR